MQLHHTPVMVKEIIEFLEPEKDRIYLDGTLGTGGHSEAILLKSAPTGKIFGIDRDSESLEIARERLAPYGDRAVISHGRYDQAPELLEKAGIGRVHGALLDLGISSTQLGMPERGFSFSRDDPLDMRMDRTQGAPAARLLNGMSEKEMAHIFRTYGEERWAARIARAVVKRQKTQGDIQTTLELAGTIQKALPGQSRRSSRIHPATRCFQALRIAVNRELEALENFLRLFPELLHKGGRCCILSFHSLEDRMVKVRFREGEQGSRVVPFLPFHPDEGREEHVPLFRRLNKKVLRPTREEVVRNPLSRSARLRVVEKL